MRPNLTLTYGLRYDYITRATGSGLQSGPDLRTGEWLLALPSMPPVCAGQAPRCLPAPLETIPFNEFIRTTGEEFSIRPRGGGCCLAVLRIRKLYNAGGMQASEFDEVGFFRAIHESGARALLIGRRALVLLGLPVLTADYDFWIAIDDIAVFNGAVAPCGLLPTREPDEARRRGRYAVENDEHVDVLVARSVTTMDGVEVAFDAVWSRRQRVVLGGGVDIHIPARDDLILTKRFADRPRDLEDIRLLRALDPEGTS